MAKQTLKPLKKTQPNKGEKNIKSSGENIDVSKENIDVSKEVLDSPRTIPPPAKKYKKQYWNTKIHIPGIGTVSGEATEAQIEGFKRWSKGAADIQKYLSDIDELEIAKQKRIKAARKKMGLI